MKLHSKHSTFFGYDWWLRMGKKSGIIIHLIYPWNGLDFRFGPNYLETQDCTYYGFTFFNLDITYFPEVSW